MALIAQTASLPQAPTASARPDALLLYRQGRDLEVAGKQAEALAKYQEAVGICDQELAVDARRIESYVVKCWCLFRLGKHQDVINVGTVATKVQFDARVSEVMGESYFFLGQNELALRAFQRYFESVPDSADRVSTAYFYVGETYFRLKKYSHADMAYSTAVLKEPSMPRWWYRLGLTCESLGEWKRAYEAYGKALALSPALPEAISGRDRVKGKIE